MRSAHEMDVMSLKTYFMGYDHIQIIDCEA